ncbi:MAG: xerD, partial [Schumannella sp.]|nr:xerD [Schumannella sp.]
MRKIHRVLSLSLDMAVEDGRLSRNVATHINLPRPVKHEKRYLTHGQVEDLAHACGYPADVSKHRALDERKNEMYRLVVLFLAYTGVRFGEMAALRVRRLDLLKRRAVIAESATPVQGHGLVWDTPKPTSGVRSPSPDSWSTTSPDTSRARPRTTWCSAASAAIGIPDLHPHQLRHTAASLAIASGADVKVVQQMLGHASATMTLDTYGHLFANRLDEVADAMDLARTKHHRDAGREVVPLPRVARALPETVPDPDAEDPLTGVSAGQGVFFHGSPDGIRTRATALRGRRARPLHNGAMEWSLDRMKPYQSASCCCLEGVAGILGLEPRMAVPETAVLPITPYPTGSGR